MIVQVPPAGIIEPDAHDPPVMVKPLPLGPRAVTVTVGAAVSVSEPGFEEVELLVTVMVPLCEVVVPVTSERDGAEKLTAATVVVPLTATVCVAAPVASTARFAPFAPAAVEEPFRPGAKLTLIVQLPPTASVFGLAGQLFV